MLLYIAHLLTALVALEHLYILYMEMFAWETLGKKTFRSLPAHLFAPTKTLAANQGLYNGFLAAGLIWSFFVKDAEWMINIRFFFLSCIATEGIYGALTAARRIFYVQALPAIITIIIHLLA